MGKHRVAHKTYSFIESKKIEKFTVIIFEELVRVGGIIRRKKPYFTPYNSTVMKDE